MSGRHLYAFSAFLLVAQPVAAADRVVVYPVQVGAETVRYNRGVATLDLWTDNGAVQITPQPMTHGSLAFTVAVFNAGDAPVNFGIENISAVANSRPLSVFSRDDLERRAENRALWAQIGAVLIAGVGAGLSASQRNTYRSTTVTPFGVYRSRASYPSLAGQLQAQAFVGEGAWAIGAIQSRLDHTRAALATEIVQITTVDPGEGYAGTFVLHRVRGDYPFNVRLSISWNGQAYPFEFLVGRRGTPRPHFAAITPQTPPERLLASLNFSGPPAGVPSARRLDRAGTASAPRSSSLLVEADTPSGYCINADSSYRGTGSLSRPAVTSARPLCFTLQSRN